MASKVDVYQLSDVELYNRLRNHNVTIGPVVDSTRDLYRKMLQKCLSTSSRIREVENTVIVNGDDSEAFTRTKLPKTPLREESSNISLNYARTKPDTPKVIKDDEVVMRKVQNLYSDYYPSPSRYTPTARRSIGKEFLERSGGFGELSSPSYSSLHNTEANGLRQRIKPASYNPTPAPQKTTKSGVCYRCFILLSVLLVVSVILYSVYLFYMGDHQNTIDSLKDAADELLATLSKEEEQLSEVNTVDSSAADKILNESPIADGA